MVVDGSDARSKNGWQAGWCRACCLLSRTAASSRGTEVVEAVNNGGHR